MRKLLLAAGAALALAGPAYAGAPDAPLPSCEASELTQTLRQVAMKMGVALYNYNAVTMNQTPGMEWCRAVAWTSSGKRVVNFTVSWMNQAANQYWVQLTGYSRPIP